MKACIVRNNEKPTAQIESILEEHGLEHEVVEYYDASPALQDQFDLFILTGGTLDFKDAAFEGERQFIAKSVKPVFGICMGLQFICDVYGEAMIKLPVKVDGIQTITVNGLVRLGMDYSDGPLAVSQSHWCAVPHCPEGFTQYALSENGVEMIVHNERPIWATQFHPERTENNSGRIVLDHFLRTVKSHGRF